MVHICICIHVVHSNQARPHENRKSYHASVSRFLLAQKCICNEKSGLLSWTIPTWRVSEMIKPAPTGYAAQQLEAFTKHG